MGVFQIKTAALKKAEGGFDGPPRFVEVQDLVEIRAVGRQKD